MKKALVIIDMQNDFVDGALANPMAQAIVTPIAEYMKAFDGDLIATRDTHAETYLASSEGKYLPVVHCVHGTHGWEIVPEIMQVLTEQNGKLIDKPTFGNLNWECLQGYDEVTLVGTCTDICVVSNALILKAQYPDMVVKVKGDLCAGTTKENHESALAVMACCQVERI
ncbi:MAG: cysteine hydrolase [Clostridia bacterium]|nr:cysteine hydrolase [Clostridia bacterium]